MVDAKKFSAVFFVMFFLFFTITPGFHAESPEQATSSSAKKLPLTIVPPKMTRAARVVSRQKEIVQAKVPAFQIPDLLVESFKRDKASAKIGEDVKLTTKVINNSNGPSSACTLRLTFAWESPGPFSFTKSWSYDCALPALAPGESVTQEVFFSFSMAGPWESQAFADSALVVNETDEGNNKKRPTYPLVIYK